MGEDGQGRRADADARFFFLEAGKRALRVFSSHLMESGVEQQKISAALKSAKKEVSKAVNDLHMEWSLKHGSISDARKAQEMRKDFVGRLIVHEIGDLFPSYDDEETIDLIRKEYVPGKIPREVIPGYIEAIKDMFGDEYISLAQKILGELIVELKDPYTGLVDWVGFYEHPVATKERRDIYLRVKQKLEENENLFTWFINRITGTERFTKNMKRDLHEEEFKLIFNGMFKSLGDLKPAYPF